MRTTGWLRRTVVAGVAALAVGIPGAFAQSQAPESPPAQPPTTGSSPAQAPEGVPIIFRGEEVGRVFRPYGPFSPTDRANLASRRLGELAFDYSISPADLTVTHLPTSSEILYGDRVLWVITDEDVQAPGADRRAVAEDSLLRIRQIMNDTRQQFTREAIVRGVGTMATVTVLLGLAIWALLRTGRRLVAIIGRRPYRILPTLERFEVITANRLANLLVRVVRLSQVVLIVLAVIVWVQINLAALPWTRPYARVGLSWLAAPVRMVWNSTVGFIPNFFYLLVIAAIAYGILRFSHLLSRLVGRGRIRLGGFDPSWAEPTYKLARVLIIAFALVAAFPYIPGSNSPAFRGISLFLGFFVTLASSSAISNIISGVILTYSGAFDIGERVRIAETTGDVISKTLLTTHVRTIKNVKVAIPNALVLGGHILNYSAMAAGHGLILHTSVTIGYDTPWRRVHELLIAAALASEGVAREPAPFVLQTALNDFHVSYELNAYTREAHQMAVTYSNLHKNIQDAFHRAGVEIMSPHYSALRDGNRSTIGDENLGPAYHQPAFRVEQVEPAADLDSPPALKLQDRS